jgi:small-conductance mechanosensitive channel
MSEIFDVEAWRQVFVRSLTQLGETLAGFLPSLVATLVIIVVGWVVSRLVAAIAERLLRQLGLDGAAARIGVSATLREGGVSAAPSRIVAGLVFWVLMLTFLLSAVETLGLSAVTLTIDRLIGFLPNVIAAGLIFVLGLLLARLVRNLVSSGAAAADLGQAPRLGSLAHGVVALVAGVVALEQLGVETGIVVTVLTAIVAAMGVTIGIAFALGARPVITHVLAGHFLRQSIPSGSSIEIEGQRGVVERVGAVDTLVRDEEHSWSIPNGKLLEVIVIR